jgi:hypothetical protein
MQLYYLLSIILFNFNIQLNIRQYIEFLLKYMHFYKNKAMTLFVQFTNNTFYNFRLAYFCYVIYAIKNLINNLTY